MRGRSAIREYHWPDAEHDLGAGVHPEVVAARLGEPIDYLLQVADDQGWPITWRGSTPDQILDAAGRWLDA